MDKYKIVIITFFLSTIVPRYWITDCLIVKSTSATVFIEDVGIFNYFFSIHKHGKVEYGQANIRYFEDMVVPCNRVIHN